MSEKGFVYILKDTHFKRGVKMRRPADLSSVALAKEDARL